MNDILHNSSALHPVYTTPSARPVPVVGRAPICVSANIQDYNIETEFNWD